MPRKLTPTVRNTMPSKLQTFVQDLDDIMMIIALIDMFHSPAIDKEIIIPLGRNSPRSAIPKHFVKCKSNGRGHVHIETHTMNQHEGLEIAEVSTLTITDVKMLAKKKEKKK
ncbi:hypothetical protein PCE1_003070 [Barthelona sp. PCE]